MNITAIIKNAKVRHETSTETISAMRKNVETLQDALENWDIYTAKKAAESTLRQHNKWERAIQADRMNTREEYTTEYRGNKELEEIVAMDNEMIKDLTKVQGETAKAVRDIRDAHKIAKIEAAIAEEAREAAAIEAAAKKAAAIKAAAKKAETEEAAAKTPAQRTETMHTDESTKAAKVHHEMATEMIAAMRKNVETLQDALENWDIDIAKKAAESTLSQHKEWARAIQNNYSKLPEIEEVKDEVMTNLWDVEGETEKVVSDIQDAHKKIEADMKAAANLKANPECAVAEAERDKARAEIKALREQLNEAEEAKTLREQLNEAQAEAKALREQLNETEEVHAEAAEGEDKTETTKPEANEDKTETTTEDDEIERAVLNAKANDARAQEDMELMKREISMAREVIAMSGGRYVEKSQATKLVRENNKIAERTEGIRTQTRELVLSGKGNDALRECMQMEMKTRNEMENLREETKKVADEIRFIAMRNGQ